MKDNTNQCNQEQVIFYEQVALWDRFNSLCPTSQKMIIDRYEGFDLLQKALRNNMSLLQEMVSEEGMVYIRPRTLIRCGLLFVLQSMENLSVDDLIYRANADIGFQYVLVHTSCNDHVTLSRSTYCNFLQSIVVYEKNHGINVFEKIFTDFTDLAAVEMGLNLHKPLEGFALNVRMDSMLIDTPAEHLTRAGIIYRSNKYALRMLAGTEGCARIPDSLKHYLNESDENAEIYHNDKEVRMTKLQKLLNESVTILNLYEGEQKLFDEYVILTRCINEQGTWVSSTEVVAKSDNEIRPFYMQSPLYPNATYVKKYGHNIGESVCVAEAFSEDVALLTKIYLDKNSVADSVFMERYLEEKPVDSPMQICYADAAFFSMGLVNKASEKGVVLFPTDLKGSVSKPLTCEFKLDEECESVLSCPEGKKPIPGSAKYKDKTGVITAKFEKKDCSNCPNRDKCPVEEQKRAYKIEITKDKIDFAEFHANLGSEMFLETANFRNAVESIPSVFRRKYGVDDMHTFSLSMRKNKVFGAGIAYNLKKLRKFRKAKDKPEDGAKPAPTNVA